MSVGLVDEGISKGERWTGCSRHETKVSVGLAD